MRRIKFHTGEIIQGTRVATTKALDTVTKEMAAALQKKVGKQTGLSGPASRPGRPPRRRTGALQGSIQVVRKGRQFAIRLFQYGIWLEGGTGKMLARPFVAPVIHDKQAKWTRRINTLIRKNRKPVK